MVEDIPNLLPSSLPHSQTLQLAPSSPVKITSAQGIRSIIKLAYFFSRENHSIQSASKKKISFFLSICASTSGILSSQVLLDSILRYTDLQTCIAASNASPELRNAALPIIKNSSAVTTGMQAYVSVEAAAKLGCAPALRILLDKPSSYCTSSPMLSLLEAAVLSGRSPASVLLLVHECNSIRDHNEYHTTAIIISAAKNTKSHTATAYSVPILKLLLFHFGFPTLSGVLFGLLDNSQGLYYSQFLKPDYDSFEVLITCMAVDPAKRETFFLEILEAGVGLPLLVYAAWKRHARAIDALLSCGCPPDVKSMRSGWTALMLATRNRDHESIVKLLAAGADTNLRLFDRENHKNATALHFAASSGCVLCTDALLHAGADPFAQLHIPTAEAAAPARPRRPVVLQSARHHESEQLLGGHGIDARELAAASNYTEFRPIELAAFADAPDVVFLLGRAMQDALTTTAATPPGSSSLDRFGRSRYDALKHSVVHGRTSVVEMLLHAGVVDVDAVDDDGYGGLHWAVCNGDLRMVLTLLRAGADFRCRAVDGSLPIDLVEEGFGGGEIGGMVRLMLENEGKEG